jgi:uncharacterized protein
MQLTEEFIAGLAVNEAAIADRIAGELSVKPAQVSATVRLIRDGCTVPFISRYRKELTGSLDEVQVREVSHRLVSYGNLEERRLEIIRAVFSQGKLSEDLYENLRRCDTLSGLEDIYAPCRKKKKTRGMIAREKGLEPLARILCSEGEDAVRGRAGDFIRQDAEHPELSVASAEEAIQGAMDIVAENVSQDAETRAAVKALYLGTGSLVVKGVGDDKKKEQSTYGMYWDYREPLSTLRPHRVLAVNRGEREGELAVKIEVDEDAASGLLQGRVTVANRFHGEAIDDGLRRLLSPAVLREIRVDAASRADEHGIGIFSLNLRNLLMQPPIKGTRVLGIDPGIRTGSKCVALDETGKLLGYFVMNQERDLAGAKKAIAEAVKKHNLQLIAVGNGTASHEVRRAVSDAISENGLEAKYTVVDEDGASVYSASDVAREEFPELDLTIRGAVSIGRRLQDPLAELVKIDPKSIGVGLYQHDVDRRKLSETLDETVGSVVNNVGVNLNTASPSLLKYVSGINASLARKIVKFREQEGRISSRELLMAVPGMGPKSFEQCAGFLKIPESSNPLDNTWVHPENYSLAAEMLPLARAAAGLSREKKEELKARYGVGETTIQDITSELAKPNRDPREDYPMPILQQGVLGFEDLKEGMKVTGKVKNVVDFGAFVDIGIKETALLHISEMAEGFVKDPMSVLKVGDTREFRIISLDAPRKRIGLSLRPAGARRTEPGAKGVRSPRSDAPRPDAPRPSADSPRGDTVYNPFADLLKKKKE